MLRLVVFLALIIALKRVVFLALNHCVKKNMQLRNHVIAKNKKKLATLNCLPTLRTITGLIKFKELIWMATLTRLNTFTRLTRLTMLTWLTWCTLAARGVRR